jgi:hypothetical protein
MKQMLPFAGALAAQGKLAKLLASYAAANQQPETYGCDLTLRDGYPRVGTHAGHTWRRSGTVAQVGLVCQARFPACG